MNNKKRTVVPLYISIEIYLTHTLVIDVVHFRSFVVLFLSSQLICSV